MRWHTFGSSAFNLTGTTNFNYLGIVWCYGLKEDNISSSFVVWFWCHFVKLRPYEETLSSIDEATLVIGGTYINSNYEKRKIDFSALSVFSVIMLHIHHLSYHANQVLPYPTLRWCGIYIYSNCENWVKMMFLPYTKQ